MTKKKNMNEKAEKDLKTEEDISTEGINNGKSEQETVGTTESSDETELVTLPLEELEVIKSKSAENFEGWQRERADFLNYKKRVEREQLSLKGYIVADLVKKYLAVLDDMELAFKNKPDCETCNGWVDGVGLIQQKLKAILENEGVALIEAEGLEFDPNVHEAVTQIDSPDHESGTVIEVMRQGYKIGERVIRPALVIIAR